jgi:hypothetical protein
MLFFLGTNRIGAPVGLVLSLIYLRRLASARYLYRTSNSLGERLYKSL